VSKKCPSCNSCLDIIWIMPRRFYHCWLEDVYYDLVDNKIVVVDVEKELGIHKEILSKMIQEKSNEKFQ